MIDQALKQRVLDELAWQPGFDDAHIGVMVRCGVVTLTGHVGSYAEKCVAERAAGRVTGVRAIAEELEIRYASGIGQNDEDIARKALDVMSWDLSVPKDRVKIKIERGWVTLRGDVDWRFQDRRRRRTYAICSVLWASATPSRSNQKFGFPTSKGKSGRRSVAMLNLTPRISSSRRMAVRSR